MLKIFQGVKRFALAQKRRVVGLKTFILNKKSKKGQTSYITTGGINDTISTTFLLHAKQSADETINNIVIDNVIRTLRGSYGGFNCYIYDDTISIYSRYHHKKLTSPQHTLQTQQFFRGYV